MKKIVLLMIVSAIIFTGCAVTNENNEVIGYKGFITGTTYKTGSLVRVYQVISKGVVTFMTEEEIKQANLDKLDTVIKYSHSINEGKLINEEVVK